MWYVWCQIRVPNHSTAFQKVLILKKVVRKFAFLKKLPYLCARFQEINFSGPRIRDVAQLVRVHVWGARGRLFESGHPDRIGYLHSKVTDFFAPSNVHQLREVSAVNGQEGVLMG